jgi:hypothetical protein
VWNLVSDVKGGTETEGACEYRVLRRIFGLNGGGVIGSWRKLHNEELSNLYSSSKIIGLNKTRRLRWEEHVDAL